MGSMRKIILKDERCIGISIENRGNKQAKLTQVFIQKACRKENITLNKSTMIAK